MSQHFGWIELVFTSVIAFGFGFYQLWSVNREIRQDKAKRAAETAEAKEPSKPDGPSVG